MNPFKKGLFFISIGVTIISIVTKGMFFLMNWLQKFMYGRHGTDQLNIALLVLYMVLALIGQLTGLWFLYYLGFAAIIWSFFRMFSRNHEKRWAENQAFLGIWSPISSRILSLFRHQKDKTHRYFHCPKCKATLRVPKGRGKIEITCPKCQTVFVKKT